MQSSKYKIFGHGRPMDAPQNQQGRNVTPFSSNKKLEPQSQKQIQSPFDGYTSMVTDNTLAQSQVSDLNIELTRRLIREQLNRLGGVDQGKIKGDVDLLKTEIRSLKEVIATQSSNKSRDDDQFKRQLLKDFDKLMEEYHEQTARNLRQVIKTFDEGIKKDCSIKYLPIEFLNDVEKQFFEMEDKIQLVASKVDGSKKQKTEDPVILAETFELRLKKGERETESLKKSISEVQGMLHTLNDNMMAIKSKQSEDDDRIGQKFQELKNSITETKKQSKTTSNTIEDLKKQATALRKKISTLETNQTNPPYLSEIHQYMLDQKGMAVSRVYQNEDHEGRPSLFKSPVKEVSSLHDISTTSVSESKQLGVKTDDVSICYRIDKDNYLLDEDGNYILNQAGKEIQLTEEQISLLRKSTLVKLRE